MGLSLHKTKSISGLALITAIVAGCGGGGGSSTPATQTPPGGSQPNAAGTFTVGSTNCAAISTAQTLANSTGALLGSCEEFVASPVPTKAVTAFINPTAAPVVAFNGSSYDISAVGTTKVTLSTSTDLIPASDLTRTSFGNYLGLTYGISDASNGAGSRVYDLRNTTDTFLVKKLDLAYSRFGIFNRFNDRTLGYYGGWTLGDGNGNLPPNKTVPFSGVLVGVIGPSSSGTAGGTPLGFSADVKIEVNFTPSGSSVSTLELSAIRYTQNGSQQINQQLIAGGTATVQSAPSSSSPRSISASFTTPVSGTNSPIEEGSMSGTLHGNSGVDVTELVGTVKFRTKDGRNAIGAFGAK
jgi:hypothetical protein